MYLLISLGNHPVLFLQPVAVGDLLRPKKSLLAQSRFFANSEEQIVGVLREQETGVKTANVCRKYRISPATFYK
jgi:hypothetical protein